MEVTPKLPFDLGRHTVVIPVIIPCQRESRRFQKIDALSPSVEHTVAILRGLKSCLESRKGVQLQLED